MTLKKYGFPLLVIVAFIIYGFRFWQSNYYCDALCIEAGKEPEFNIKAFKKLILDKYPEIFETPFRLIVFLDLENDCKACLFETSFWLEPKGKSDAYDVTFFMPVNTDSMALQNFKIDHDIKDYQIVFFEPGSTPEKFHKYGVLKVFVSNRQNGVEWYQLGNSNEEQYQNLLRKILSSLPKDFDSSG